MTAMRSIVFLARVGTDVGAREKQTPKTIVALFGHETDDGALDWTGKYTIQTASINRELSVTVGTLVAVGADINRRTSRTDMTALGCAVLGGNIDVLVSLIGCGAGVRASGTHGDTPLHVSAIRKSVGALDFPARAGTDVGARENT